MKKINIFVLSVLFMITNHIHASEVDDFIRLISQLPEQAFQHAQESISDETTGEFNLDVLLKNRKTKTWIVDVVEKDIIEIRNNYSSDNIFKIIPLDVTKRIICIETQNAQSTNFECWQKKAEKEKPGFADILPKIQVNDFLKKADYFPSGVKKNIYFYLKPDKSINAALYIWMDPDFENRDIYWSISLKWNGKEFKVIKKKED